ncbi:MAG: type II secretion system protein N [Gammaproteobacteria bacterium]|jgi:general secretion pathway protein N|nr:hypothetical protein [Chromatiales bacterium]MDP6675722.1 type II secretion system protein N [Gammaproteobacteria bacterium]
MRRTYLLTGVGIASFILFIIVTVPASIITNQLRFIGPGSVQINGVDGTAWNGRIRSLNINGIQLHDTYWDLSPAALLLGRLSASVMTRAAGSEISFTATLRVSGNMAIHDLDATGPVRPIASKFNLPITTGRYQVQLSALNINDGWPTRFIGSGQVTDIPLNFMGGTSGPTGSYRIIFDIESVSSDGRLLGMLSDDGGPVEVGGNIELTPPMNYALQIKLKARPGAPTEITQALNLAGPVGPDGRHEISFAGSL